MRFAVAERSVRGSRPARLLLVAALLAAPPAGRASADIEKLADASLDRVGRTTVVPDPSRKMGEVRLVERGDAVVVQTLLATKLLSRVLGEIGKKEEGNWPKDYEPTRAYLAALDAARETLESARDDRNRADRRRRLLIEFAADDNDAVVLVGTFDSDPEMDRIVPTRRRIFTRLSLPRSYVLRNMRLILADSYRVAERDVDRLGVLGPAAAHLVAPGMPVAAPEGNGSPPATPANPPTEAEKR